MRITFPTEITDVIHRKLNKHVSGLGKEALFTTESAGWYLQIDNAITVFVGDEMPSLAAGDKINLIIERR